MNPSNSGQDVLLCNLCKTTVPPLCCEVCDIYLCKGCAGEHIMDESNEHTVVPIKKILAALLYPNCLKHSSRKCELYCEQCTISICVQCVSSEEHKGHGFKDLLECVERKKADSQKDLQELESSILTEQKEFANRIRNQKADLDKTLENLNSSIEEHGEKLHKQVSDVVKKFKSEIAKKHEEKFAVITKTDEGIASLISDIEKNILSIKELQTSRDLGLVLDYNPRNEEFKNAHPPTHNVTLPTFKANEIKSDKLYELFGSLTMASDVVKPMKQDVKPKSPTVKPCTTKTTDEFEGPAKDFALKFERDLDHVRPFLRKLGLSPPNREQMNKIFQDMEKPTQCLKCRQTFPNMEQMVKHMMQSGCINHL